MAANKAVTCEQLVKALNEDLAREFQGTTGYVNYSHLLKGAASMHIARELERHAGEELAHALTIATVVAKPVEVSDDAETMLRADLRNETETIRQYRRRVIQSADAPNPGIA